MSNKMKFYFVSVVYPPGHPKYFENWPGKRRFGYTFSRTEQEALDIADLYKKADAGITNGDLTEGTGLQPQFFVETVELELEDIIVRMARSHHLHDMHDFFNSLQEDLK